MFLEARLLCLPKASSRTESVLSGVCFRDWAILLCVGSPDPPGPDCCVTGVVPTYQGTTYLYTETAFRMTPSGTYFLQPGELQVLSVPPLLPEFLMLKAVGRTGRWWTAHPWRCRSTAVRLC